MYKEDLVLNNLQWLICLKTKPNQTNRVTIGSDTMSEDWIKCSRDLQHFTLALTWAPRVMEGVSSWCNG